MKTQDSPTHPRRCARGPAGLGLLALEAVVWGPQGFMDKQPGPPEPVTAEFPSRRHQVCWWGAVYGAHNGGNPRRSSQDCLHHHLSHLSPQRLLRLSGEAESWADPPRPAYTTPRAGDTSPCFEQAGGRGRRILCSPLEPPPSASPSAWLGILEGRGDTFFPLEAWRPKSSGGGLPASP